MALRAADAAGLAFQGLRGHPLRFFLSALGIAIGVAAMVAVGGVTESSRVELNQTLDRLGTNMLTVVPAKDRDGNETRLPATAGRMLGNIGPVTSTSVVGRIDDLAAYRTPYVPSGRTGGVFVAAVDSSLLTTLRGDLAHGTWFTTAGESYPTVVLGHQAARNLGISLPGTRLWIGNHWAVVVGILRPLDLAEGLDPGVLLPMGAAQDYFGYDGTATSVYLRVDERQVDAVVAVIPQTAAPQRPELVLVDQPSDALEAKLAADDALNRLLIALAAIGLLVGGIGVSNTMIIASLERRSEIGLRRALGATRGNIATQFLAESTLMAAMGGLLGSLLGCLVTAYYTRAQDLGFALPLWLAGAAVVLTAVVGGVAGLYPAFRASRESPVAALTAQ